MAGVTVHTCVRLNLSRWQLLEGAEVFPAQHVGVVGVLLLRLEGPVDEGGLPR